MLQSKSDRVRLHLRTDFVHITFVRERILLPQRRAEGTGKKRARDRMRDDTLASNASCTATIIANATGQVGGDGVAPVAKLSFWFRGGAEFDRLGLISDQN